MITRETLELAALAAGHEIVCELVRHNGTEPDKLRAWREAVMLCAAAVGERMRGER